MIVLSSYRKVITAILWLLFVTFLFCLPGAAFPKADWMSRIQFDKWVHIVIFFGTVLLWSSALRLVSRNSLLLLLAVLVFYGLIIEIIQHKYIPHRSFDWGDLLADFIGSILGIWLWMRYALK